MRDDIVSVRRKLGSKFGLDSISTLCQRSLFCLFCVTFAYLLIDLDFCI